jgi:hypothetical protein
MDKEMAQFQDDLLASVKQMKAGQAVRVTETVFPCRVSTPRYWTFSSTIC